MGPLDGVRVVEMGAWVAGPAAGVVLADWGADVVKIEGPGVGDPGRLFATILGGDLPFNPPFEMDNRNKRSAVVDVRSEAGLAVALDLIGRADVFLSNFRPAALERLGLGSEALLARNPGLVYGLITGYGLEGPDKDKAAYDIAGFWARAGIAHMLTQPGGVPPFQRGGMGDHSVGISTAGAICAALYSREKTGKGQLVATSLLRQGVYTLSFDLALALRLGVPLGVGDRKSMPNPVINNYCDKEGRWLWIVGLEAMGRKLVVARKTPREAADMAKRWQLHLDEEWQGVRATNASIMEAFTAMLRAEGVDSATIQKAVDAMAADVAGV